METLEEVGLKHIIVDFSSLYKVIEILPFYHGDVKFIIPDIVLADFISGNVFNEGKVIINSIINEASKREKAIIVSADQIINGHRFFRNQYPPDKVLREVYPRYVEQIESNTAILTDDKADTVFYKLLGYNVMNFEKFKEQYIPADRSNRNKNEDLENLKLSILKHSTISIVLPFIMAIVATIFASKNRYDLLNYFNTIIHNYANPWFIISIICFAGLFLFYIRSKKRLIYGISETVAGILTGLYAITAIDFSNFSLPVFLIAVASSLYVIVRGIENTGKGLRKTRLITKWHNIFGKNCFD